jgi:hypothetical protein
MSTFPTLNLQLYVLQDLISSKAEQIVPFHAKFNEINIYFFRNQFKNIL